MDILTWDYESVCFFLFTTCLNESLHILLVINSDQLVIASKEFVTSRSHRAINIIH